MKEKILSVFKCKSEEVFTIKYHEKNYFDMNGWRISDKVYNDKDLNRYLNKSINTE